MQKSVSVVSRSPVGATCRPVRLLITAVGPPERFVCGVVVVEVSFPQTLLQSGWLVEVARVSACTLLSSGTERTLSTASLQPQLEPNRVSKAPPGPPYNCPTPDTNSLCNLRVCCLRGIRPATCRCARFIHFFLLSFGNRLTFRLSPGNLTIALPSGTGNTAVFRGHRGNLEATATCQPSLKPLSTRRNTSASS